ncbi:MAG TPA: hypothetical protein VF476_11740 [Chitinophagaceae bacterium]
MGRLLIFSLCIIILLAFSCNDKNGHRVTKHRISILPFKGTDTNAINVIKAKLEERLNAGIITEQQKELPLFAYYEPRKRYVADSLLIYLEDYNAGKDFDKIIGITNSDISTRKDSHANWGVMGLAYCPGEACVISSFRVKKTSRNWDHYIDRMVVLAMHELGHTYSLPHCKSNPCIMRDAEGKMNLDNGKNYCGSCHSYLKRKGVLK